MTNTFAESVSMTGMELDALYIPADETNNTCLMASRQWWLNIDDDDEDDGDDDNDGDNDNDGDDDDGI